MIDRFESGLWRHIEDRGLEKDFCRFQMGRAPTSPATLDHTPSPLSMCGTSKCCLVFYGLVPRKASWKVGSQATFQKPRSLSPLMLPPERLSPFLSAGQPSVYPQRRAFPVTGGLGPPVASGQSEAIAEDRKFTYLGLPTMLLASCLAPCDVTHKPIHLKRSLCRVAVSGVCDNYDVRGWRWCVW